ncbi:hypothetical protein QL093DRAFT_1365566 [Fusarium oxysporum]|nr:hypothetical protein QL093DRAFT_1365566 [Fusarium oxysporum]
MDSKQSRSNVQDRSRQITGWMCCYPKLLHVWGGCNARSALIYRTRLHGQTCISLPAEPPNQSTLLNGVTPSLSDQPLVESSNPVPFNVSCASLAICK